MGTIHRSGKPPKNMFHSVTIRYEDWELDEETILAWCQDHLNSNIQYDTIRYKAEGVVGKVTFDFKIWCKSPDDLDLFINEYGDLKL